MRRSKQTLLASGAVLRISAHATQCYSTCHLNCNCLIFPELVMFRMFSFDYQKTPGRRTCTFGLDSETYPHAELSRALHIWTSPATSACRTSFPTPTSSKWRRMASRHGKIMRSQSRPTKLCASTQCCGNRDRSRGGKYLEDGSYRCLYHCASFGLNPADTPS